MWWGDYISENLGNMDIMSMIIVNLLCKMVEIQMWMEQWCYYLDLYLPKDSDTVILLNLWTEDCTKTLVFDKHKWLSINNNGSDKGSELQSTKCKGDVVTLMNYEQCKLLKKLCKTRD